VSQKYRRDEIAEYLLSRFHCQEHVSIVPFVDSAVWIVFIHILNPVVLRYNEATTTDGETRDLVRAAAESNLRHNQSSAAE
jgi:hypothetical protein